MKKVNRMGFRQFHDAVRKDDMNYVSDEAIVITDDRLLGHSWVSRGCPIQPETGIIVRIIQGEADYLVNLEPYRMSPGDMLIFPEHSIFEVLSITDDMQSQFLSFPLMDDSFTLEQHYLHISDNRLWDRLSGYIESLRQIAGVDKESADALRRTIICEFKHAWVNSNMQNVTPKKKGRSTLDSFIRCVNENAGSEHRIAFYAEQLNLSPNRLSAVIKAQSGLTVQQWINRALVQRAKILLVHTRWDAAQIADALSFDWPGTFSRFFKREVGCTPLQYREKYK